MRTLRATLPPPTTRALRSLSEKCHGKRAHVLLSSIDPRPSLARPLAYERLGAIVEWFEKLGAAVLFSIIVQTSALDEARYQVVDGSHRLRIIVDPRRVSELPPEITAEQRTELRQRVEKLNKLHQIRQHLKEDYIDVAVYNTLDPEAMLELQHRVNLLTHDARFGSSTFDVLLNLKRASLQVCRLPSIDYHHPTSPPLSGPKRYIRAALPKGEDAPAKLVKILELLLEMLCALSQLPVERQPSATNLWRIFEDAEMNRLARAMLEGSFSGSEATSTAAADLKKPIRQAEQTFMLLEAHDAAEVAAGDHPHLAFMNCLNVRPFPFRKGKVRLPAFSRSWVSWAARSSASTRRTLATCPRRSPSWTAGVSEFELVLGYWLGWCGTTATGNAGLPDARALPVRPALGGDGPPRHPRASKRMLKTVDRELREERRALREKPPSTQSRRSQSRPRATLKALSQAEPTSEAEAKAEADDEYEVKACALPPESATEEAQPSKALRNFVRRAAAAVTRLLVTRGMTPRRRNREAIRGNVRALNPKETQRASQEHEATEQEQEETQHASQDADQHHPVVFIPSAEHSSSSEHARASVLPEPPTAEPEETPEPEQTTVPEQTTEPVPEQTTIEPLETTTTEPEVTTSDPVQATTTEPAEPSEPEPAQSELQQTGTEPEAAEQSVPGEPEQLAEPEQPAEPELTPNPSRPQPLLRRPQSSPQRRTALRRRRLPLLRNRGRAPRLSRAFTAAAGCWFNRCSQDASASGIHAFQNPTCSPCRVLRLTCSPGHRHEHYCHASSSGSGSGFRASQNPTCSPGHRHEHDCHASSSGSGSGFRASQNPTCSPGHRHEHDCKASSSGSGSSFRASQNAPHRHEFHVSPSHNFESSASVVVEHRPRPSIAAGKLVPEHKPSESRSHRPCSFFETMAEYRLSGAICVELHKVLNRLGLTFGKILFSMTCGQSADIEKTYQFLTSRALMILVCLDSEAAFGVDRAVDGHMRLEELALWERTFPFYVKEVFMTVPCWNSLTTTENSSPRYSRLANVNTSLSEDERKTYDWSIQCHKFRTNTCYREIPAHWDCLFKFTGSA
ncbi:hypothetical protein PAPYR_9143 [Paratrimastix pyriformis]|uniref:Uncharacterized protein n=1 Tax=Paratrimastix pyriformis TaxID=342808 RepID=A0ABQ8U976_9EUKA|nr:hypothetical protein PAPYR_9143 [Paratrimastix pyriformis]